MARANPWKLVDLEMPAHRELHVVPKRGRHELSMFCACEPSSLVCHETRTLCIEHRADIQRLEVPDALPWPLT